MLALIIAKVQGKRHRVKEICRRILKESLPSVRFSKYLALLTELKMLVKMNSGCDCDLVNERS